MTAVLVSTKKVLELKSRGRGRVVFDSDDPDRSESDQTTITIPEQTWREMDRPAEITVMIKPGDHLNREEVS